MNEHPQSDESVRHPRGGARRRRHILTAAAGLATGIVVIAATAMHTVATPEATWRGEVEAVWEAPREPSARSVSPHDGAVRSEASPKARTPDPGATPASVAIPSMGVQAPVIAVGLDEGGGVFVPEDVRTLGWYQASVGVSAQEGSSVIVGHRDSAVQGTGALSGIENLKPGQTIEVTTADGDRESYSVTEVKLVPKSDFASVANEIFATDGEHRLTLVTCGGAFDSTARSYVSNVFVIAEPDTA